MTAEQIISQALDGTFMQYMPNGDTFVMRKVPHDFTPTVRIWTGEESNPKRQSRFKAIEWTPQMDEIIVSMKAAHHSFLAIGVRLGVSQSAVGHRFRALTKLIAENAESSMSGLRLEG